MRLAWFSAHPLRRHLAGVALWAMLAVQAIGLVHGIVHPNAQLARSSVASASVPGDLHDEGSAQCRLFDQLAQALALAALPLAVALPAPSTPPVAIVVAPERLARTWASPARGPPSLLV